MTRGGLNEAPPHPREPVQAFAITTEQEGEGCETWLRVAVLTDVWEHYSGAADPEQEGDFASPGDSGTIIDEEDWDLFWLEVDHSGEEVELFADYLVPLGPLARDGNNPPLLEFVELPSSPTKQPPPMRPRLELIEEQARTEGLVWARQIASASELTQALIRIPSLTKNVDVSRAWMDRASIRDLPYRFAHTHETLYWLSTGSQTVREAYRSGFLDGVVLGATRALHHASLDRAGPDAAI